MKKNIICFNINKYIFLIFIGCLVFNKSYAQHAKHIDIEIKAVSRPEKIWAVKHPFVFFKALRVTKHVLTVTDSIKRSPLLDRDADGGQVDAFRHTYWLALLTANIGKNKALSLGKAHEKGNYLDFKKKKRKKITSSQDFIASEMDFFNNNKGVEIGEKMSNVCYVKIQNAVIDSIIKGKMLVISKNIKNEPLDCLGNTLTPEQINFLWFTKRCLVPSNTSKP